MNKTILGLIFVLIISGMMLGLILSGIGYINPLPLFIMVASMITTMIVATNWIRCELEKIEGIRKVRRIE